uniref:DUF1758 domain-containing protein n=1 Tax=Syphacia muris TaxID=451379 RepID=A0A0N5AIP6_9BILA
MNKDYQEKEQRLYDTMADNPDGMLQLMDRASEILILLKTDMNKVERILQKVEEPSNERQKSFRSENEVVPSQVNYLSADLVFFVKGNSCTVYSSYQKRMEKVKELDLCKRCLKKGHSTDKCRSRMRSCFYCMYIEVPSDTICQRLVKEKEGKVQVRSQQSYIEEKLARRLRLRLSNPSVTEVSTFKTREMLITMRTTIAIKTKSGFQAIDVKTVNGMTEAMNITVISDNDNELEKKEFIDAKPDLLIGIDNFFKFLMNIKPREDGLYELSTKLGPIIAGEVKLEPHKKDEQLIRNDWS